MLNDALRFLLEHLHIILPSVLGLWFLSTFLSPEDTGPPLRTGPCPRCAGSGQAIKRDPMTGEQYAVPCPACRGIGKVRDFQTFKRDVYQECKLCAATGFRLKTTGPRFPDGTPAPGAKVETVRCESCVDGWIQSKDQVAAKRIVPFSRPPAPADLPVVPVVAAGFDDDDDEDFDEYDDEDEEEYDELLENEVPPVIAVPSMFADDDPPPKA